MSDTPRTISELFSLPEGSFVRFIEEIEATGMSPEEVSLMGGITGVLRYSADEVKRLKRELAESRKLLERAAKTGNTLDQILPGNGVTAHPHVKEFRQTLTAITTHLSKPQ